jgi:hypothetical protein
MVSSTAPPASAYYFPIVRLGLSRRAGFVRTCAARLFVVWTVMVMVMRAPALAPAVIENGPQRGDKGNQAARHNDRKGAPVGDSSSRK